MFCTPRLFALPAIGLALLGLLAGSVKAAEEVILPSTPNLSPDGSALSFAWRGDIWSVPTKGGVAKRLTTHTGRDQFPKFSPDGKRIAFVGDRGNGQQVFVMSADGGAPQPQTAHSAGYTLEGWYPDGAHLLTSGARDHYWKKAERFFKTRVVEKLADQRADELLFDDYGSEAALSPDGKQLLFVREGPHWTRKGYVGSQDAQIWRYDLAGKTFTKTVAKPGGCRWPLWKPDGSGFYYVCGESGVYNLCSHDLDTKTDKQLTRYTDDAVHFPTLSRDGRTLVFRKLFDLYAFDPTAGDEPRKITISVEADDLPEPERRTTLTKATAVDFTNDGLEIAFIAGGDVWVMDTELREPRQVTATPEEERDVRWSPDGESLYFVSDRDGQADIWRAKRGNAKRFWWRNDAFPVERVTQDADVETALKFSPDGKRFAYVRGLGELWTRDADGGDAKQVFASWDEPQYDWSPDGKWFVYAQYDEDFNRDVWIRPSDGSGTPYNISRHPDNDGNPVWSPDGKVIAFTGRRSREEVDIHYVWLRKDDFDTDARDRALQSALEKLQKARNKPKPTGTAATTTTTAPAQPAKTSPPDDAEADPQPKTDPAAKKTEPAPATTTTTTKSDKPATVVGATAATAATSSTRAEVKIDFDGLHERLRTIRINDAVEETLVWSPDSKKLAFTSTIRDQKGLFTVSFPSPTTPTQFSSDTGTQPRWLSEGNQIVWLSDGVPASVGSTGKQTTYRFMARQTVDVAGRYRAAFELCWRTMRDLWYDPRMGNKNWDEIRRKYRDAAAQAHDDITFSTVVMLMLGELNGSHLGFLPYSLGRRADGDSWSTPTAHLGVRFDTAYKGPGLKIRDVIPQGPTDEARSRLQKGEIILEIDGRAVDPAMDLTQVLNGPTARDIRLKVKGLDGKEREVTVRPIAYDQIPRLLYEKWVRDTRRFVEGVSKGKFGYVHIAGMDEPSLLRFEEELFSAASGKAALVIDVRENGGGSTTDHLLTMLTQPRHAIAVPRGGKPGYPQDRKVYATWNKPIVVLCNQNSFSNAEIFSHAIKTLRRGPVVGVPTAGGVISTGAVSIMDVGTMRLPFRGWFVSGTGEDMELNGCVPHIVVWPEPGQMPQGKDVQLEKALQVLYETTKAYEARPQPKLRYATERDGAPPVIEPPKNSSSQSSAPPRKPTMVEP
jgi:tricorn protease